MRMKVRMKRERWPNFLTSGNLMCGVLALVLLTRGHVVAASWLIIAAIVFDFLDGKIARMLGVSGDFGKEFDSLADIVSFGAAPAILMYVYALNKYALFGALVGVLYVICGALRLARFNLMRSRPYFLGLPITAAGGFIATIVLSGIPFPEEALIAIIFVVSYLMVSKIRYGNLKKISRIRELNLKLFLFFSFSLGALFILYLKAAPFIAMTVYVLSGPLGIDWGKLLAKGEGKDEEGEEGEEA